MRTRSCGAWNHLVEGSLRSVAVTSSSRNPSHGEYVMLPIWTSRGSCRLSSFSSQLLPFVGTQTLSQKELAIEDPTTPMRSTRLTIITRREGDRMVVIITHNTTESLSTALQGIVDAHYLTLLQCEATSHGAWLSLVERLVWDQ